MKQENFRAAIVDLIVDLDPNVTVMLGAGEGLSLITFDGQARHFLNKVHNQAYGRNWARRSPYERIEAVGWPEHVDLNLHMHLALRVPNPDLLRCLQAGRKTWGSIRLKGDYHCEQIKTTPLLYARYITKELRFRDVRENMFVYTCPGGRPEL